ncbi:hypothetical protein INH39_01955 [Massilia violaceinigra]|uniref:Uncharacterized protein n=1 Tax=Massilia violaceinigra TaxID=2045208 RepID=A0ABY4A7B3_9BURK|nr:hypothetical protein [Massilia violaceinigra]UOD30537.1 hypothetical protein INH39_01955 [Massilia violaceinigra]
MNSNQRSEGNNQSSNGANEKPESSSRGGTVEKDKLNQSQQSGTLGGSQQADRLPGSPQPGGIGGAQQSGSLGDSQQSGGLGGSKQQQGGSQQGAQIGQQSTERSGSQTGSQQQGLPGQHQSNDVAGGMPKSPGGKRLSADQDMDDDTGLSNRQNRQSADLDEGSRQSQQSNVGRRSDGTPD